MKYICIISTINAWGKIAHRKQLKTFADNNNNNCIYNYNNRATDFINEMYINYFVYSVHCDDVINSRNKKFTIQ